VPLWLGYAPDFLKCKFVVVVVVVVFDDDDDDDDNDDEDDYEKGRIHGDGDTSLPAPFTHPFLFSLVPYQAAR